ncbi:unnamed protein product [Gordionus sp. m RMFG-2023]
MIITDINLNDANLLCGCLKHKEKSPTAQKESKINIIDMLMICMILDKQKWEKLSDINLDGCDENERQHILKPLDFNELGLNANRESKMNICDWTNYKVLRTPKPKLSEFRCHVVGSGAYGMTNSS